MKISTIIDKINSKGIFVPAFQREYVWNRENAKTLITSLLKKYPTGTLLTWETNNPPELKRAEYHPEMGSITLILDGQQRVTTLYMLITGEIPPYYTEREIENDIRGLYYNLQTGELEYFKKTVMENDPFWVDITSVFKSPIFEFDLIKKYEEQKGKLPEDEYRKLIEILRGNLLALQQIKEHDFPVQTVPASANVEEAIDIFDVVNSSGTKLTDAELALSNISGKWPQAREVFKEKLFQLRDKGYAFELDFIVFLLQATLHQSGSQMRKLHKNTREEIEQAWNILSTKVIDYTINLIRDRLYIDSTDEISSRFGLIPLMTYVYMQPDKTLNEEQINNALNWFLLSQLWWRYVSQTPQKLDSDLRDLKLHESNPFSFLRDKILEERGRLELRADDIVGRGSTHPVYKLMILSAKSKGAVCFGTGHSIRTPFGEKYRLESDHIFPFSKLKKMGYNRENHLKYKLAQELSNRALITRLANERKNDKTPDIYLQSVKEKYPKALENQFIPMNTELWDMNKFEDFLASRRIIIAEAINDFVNNFLVKEAEQDEVNIAQLISFGESRELEFKTTLRWDVRNACENKGLEKMVLKSIAGFLNSEGGQLIIGVEDNGSIYGLENDYSLLGDKGKDGFENHLVQLIKSSLGTVVVQNIDIDFQKIEDKEVCLITVDKADKPVYTKVDGPETFYVRTGNSTTAMSLSETNDYINSHWK